MQESEAVFESTAPTLEYEREKRLDLTSSSRMKGSTSTAPWMAETMTGVPTLVAPDYLWSPWEAKPVPRPRTPVLGSWASLRPWLANRACATDMWRGPGLEGCRKCKGCVATQSAAG